MGLGLPQAPSFCFWWFVCLLVAGMFGPGFPSLSLSLSFSFSFCSKPSALRALSLLPLDSYVGFADDCFWGWQPVSHLGSVDFKASFSLVFCLDCRLLVWRICFAEFSVS